MSLKIGDIVFVSKDTIPRIHNKIGVVGKIVHIDGDVLLETDDEKGYPLNCVNFEDTNGFIPELGKRYFWIGKECLSLKEEKREITSVKDFILKLLNGDTLFHKDGSSIELDEYDRLTDVQGKSLEFPLVDSIQSGNWSELTLVKGEFYTTKSGIVEIVAMNVDKAEPFYPVIGVMDGTLYRYNIHGECYNDKNFKITGKYRN